MSGFVAIYREALDHPLLSDPSRLGAWIWLISKAAWKPTRFDVNGKIITLDRGQLSISYRGLASEWGWSRSSVERFFTRLKTETMVTTATETGRMVITICNYGKYQDINYEPETATETLPETGAGQERDIKEQGNKGTSNHSKEKNTKKEIFPKPDFTDEQTWSDFLKNRKTKKLPNTVTAHNRFLSDIEKVSVLTGWTPMEVFKECVGKGWGAIYDPRGKDNGNTNRKINNAKPASNDGLGNAFRKIAGGGVDRQAQDDGQRTRGAKIFMLADAKA